MMMWWGWLLFFLLLLLLLQRVLLLAVLCCSWLEPSFHCATQRRGCSWQQAHQADVDRCTTLAVCCVF